MVHVAWNQNKLACVFMVMKKHLTKCYNVDYLCVFHSDRTSYLAEWPFSEHVVLQDYIDDINAFIYHFIYHFYYMLLGIDKVSYNPI